MGLRGGPVPGPRKMQSADSAGLKSFPFSCRDRIPATEETRGSDTEKHGLFRWGAWGRE